MSIKNNHMEENRKLVLGMEVGLLLEDAEKWWDTRGKDLLQSRTFSDDSKEQQEALNATNPVHPNYLGGKSGILLGLPWIMLTVKERYQVVKAYTLTMKEVQDGEETGR